MMMASQVLLWGTRIWFRWRIVKVDAAPSDVEYKPLRILDLMIATGAVAVVLTLAKLGNFREYESDAGYLAYVFIGAAIAMVISAAIVLPCLWAGLRRPVPAGGKSIAAAAHAAVVFVTMVVIVAFLGPGPPPGEAWGGFFTVATIHWAIMMLILSGCRRCGYALRWKQE